MKRSFAGDSRVSRRSTRIQFKRFLVVLKPSSWISGQSRTTCRTNRAISDRIELIFVKINILGIYCSTYRMILESHFLLRMNKRVYGIPLNRQEFEMLNYMHVHSMTPFRIKTPKASRVQSYCHSYCHTKCHALSVTCSVTGFFGLLWLRLKWKLLVY